ncbi:MAG TPA: mechanosensitive ion channel domain-containing protein [Acidobacteriota bacterium]|nr:mechanosensitive ion channel domain-containing protein [Acidobacteriota bacterium]
MNPQFKMHSSFLKTNFVFVVSCIVFSWCVDWITVQAAEQPKTPPQASATKQAPAVPVAIPAAEIIPRGEQALRSLQEARFQIAADSDAALNSLQRDITAFAEKSDRRWQGESEMIEGVRSLQQLNDILRDWSLEQSQLEGWDRTLSRRSQILIAQENDIAQIYETWEVTRAAGKQQTYPKVALQKVAEVLREAEAVRGLIRNAMAKLLNLQIQLANRRDILAKVRNDIDKAREQSGRELFVLDSLPLWKALFNRESQDVITVQAIQSSQRFVDDSKEFVQKNRDRMLWHVVYFLAMVLLFRFLRRGLTPQAVERLEGSSALFILDRLFATSFLLALIATPLFYHGAPAAILRIATLPTVIPVCRLLPRLLPKTFRRWVYMLVVIYVLDFLRYLLPADWFLTRLLLLVIAGGGCLGLGWLLRSRRAEVSVSGKGERFTLQAIRLVWFLFAGSIVSNFVGNLTLAELLVSAPVRSAYAATLIFAAAHLIMTLTVVALQSPPAQHLRSVVEYGDLIGARCHTLIQLVAIIFWVGICLSMFGVLGDIWAAGADFLQLRWKVGAAEISIQDVAAFLTVFLSAMIFSRILRFVLAEEILPRIRLPRGVPGAVDVLSRYGILLLGFFIALAAAGVDLSKVTLLVSAIGVGVGFGLQNVVNNFVSGLILVFEHPLQVGDLVEVGTIAGEVRKIGFRASVLRTADGADVIIPNGELVGGRLINWSLSDRLRRISISVGAAYGTEPNRVIDILLSTARKHPAVLAEPAPLAVFDRFGDSALNFTLLCWSLVDTFLLARSELTIAIEKAFKEAGIQIPFPQQDVHVHWPESVTLGEHADDPKDLTRRKAAERAEMLSTGASIPKK